MLGLIQDSEMQYRWEILAYELQAARHSFVAFPINSESIFMQSQAPKEEKVVPRDRMIHQDPAKYSYFCGPNVAVKAIFCPTTHLLVVTGTTVQDFKLEFGELITSELAYFDWPLDVTLKTDKAFNAPLNTYKTVGFSDHGNIAIVGGALMVRLWNKMGMNCVIFQLVSDYFFQFYRILSPH